MHKCILLLSEAHISQETFSASVELPVLAATDSIKCAKQWLAACDESHAGCRPASPGKMPTRLLFLNASVDDDGDESLSVRLVETYNWTHRARSALSHCWGRSDFIKLKHDTLDSFTGAIPLHQLTKMFKDAVKVTHFLGLQYLRIDSLCIVQDSKTDWGKEAGRMSFVYSESYITIAAAAAEDGTMGLFLKDWARVDAAIIPSGFSSAMALVAERCIHIQGVHGTTLSARAWVRQERLLSNRSIHFGCGELFWECRSRDACETLPNGLPEDLMLLNRRPRPPFYDDWQEIVESYSRCKLTFATDKLVALAGLACVASRASDDEYVAGMWRSKLLNMLSWHRDLLPHENYLIPAKNDPKEYVAPTWFWASVDESIQFVHYLGSSSLSVYNHMVISRDCSLNEQYV